MSIFFTFACFRVMIEVASHATKPAVGNWVSSFVAVALNETSVNLCFNICNFCVWNLPYWFVWWILMICDVSNGCSWRVLLSCVYLFIHAVDFWFKCCDQYKVKFKNGLHVWCDLVGHRNSSVSCGVFILLLDCGDEVAFQVLFAAVLSSQVSQASLKIPVLLMCM